MVGPGHALTGNFSSAHVSTLAGVSRGVPELRGPSLHGARPHRIQTDRPDDNGDGRIRGRLGAGGEFNGRTTQGRWFQSSSNWWTRTHSVMDQAWEPQPRGV